MRILVCSLHDALPISITCNEHTNECRYYVILSRCLIIGIRQFKHYVIWKECWLKYEEGGETDSEGVMEKDNFDKKRY